MDVRSRGLPFDRLEFARGVVPVTKPRPWAPAIPRKVSASAPLALRETGEDEAPIVSGKDGGWRETDAGTRLRLTQVHAPLLALARCRPAGSSLRWMSG